MTAEEHLAELLDQKNQLIEELEEKVNKLKTSIRGMRNGWMTHRSLPKEQTLPVPRLEMIVWRDNKDYPTYGWDYRIVYKHWTDDIIAVPLGQTTSSGRVEWPPRDQNGKLDLPFRDGFHIRCDATRLKLPAYIIAENEVQVIEPFPQCRGCGKVVHPDWLRDGECRSCSPGRFP